MLTATPTRTTSPTPGAGSTPLDWLAGAVGWLSGVWAGFIGWLGEVWAWFAVQAGPLAALATIIAAFVAVFALRAASRDSRDRSRPVVLASFRRAKYNDQAFDLVTHNYGPSAAKEIRISFDPPFTEEQKSHRNTQILAERYERKIAVLPPGSNFANLWWSPRTPQPGEAQTHNSLRTPDEVTMTITYKGNRFRRYKEIVKLDTRWMTLETYSVSSTSAPGRAKQSADALTKIASELRQSRFLLRDVVEELELARTGGSPPSEENIVQAPERQDDQHPPTGDIDIVMGEGGQIQPGDGGGNYY